MLKVKHKVFPRLIISLLFTLAPMYICAGNKIIYQTKHTHTHEREEIGVSSGAVYLINDKEWVYGMHVHYVYRAFNNQKFGVGFGYEHLFDEHKHDFVGIIGAYSPIQDLTFSVSPGITIEGEESKESTFTTHFECVYEFKVKSFHIGPEIDLSYSSHHSHVGAGIHIAYGF